MWSLFGKHGKRPEGIVAVTIKPDGIAVARLKGIPGSFQIDHCEFLPCADSEQHEKLLGQHIEEHEWGYSRCVYVLQPTEYRLLLIDKPDVAEDELRNAVRWAIMDLIGFPVEEAGVDLFEAPTLAGVKKIYVVVSHIPQLKKVAHLIERVDLELVRIDIMELALCYGLSAAQNDKQGVALLFANQKGANILVVRDHTLLLERRFDLSLPGEVPVAEKEVSAPPAPKSEAIVGASADQVAQSGLADRGAHSVESSDLPGGVVLPPERPIVMDDLASNTKTAEASLTEQVAPKELLSDSVSAAKDIATHEKEKRGEE